VSNTRKISIFGAGGTGGAIAQLLTMRQYSAVALIDIAGDLAIGKSIDIAQSGTLYASDTNLLAGEEHELAKDSDVIIITAGIGRKPGLNREDLLATNADVVQEISRAIKILAPNAFVIVLTNPADILARIVLDTTQFPAHRVMAQGGILDSARLAYWIAQLAGVSRTHVRTMVLGGHGDHMVPVRRFCSVHGVPATDLLSEDAWQTAVAHTRFGGGEILAKFKTHGAAITPAHAVVAMVDALSSQTPQLLPISTQSQGAYGLAKDVFIGLPTKLSIRGVEQVMELPLTETEIARLRNSAQAMTEAYETWRQHQSE
jgi:malate dehydrogenase